MFKDQDRNRGRGRGRKRKLELLPAGCKRKFQLLQVFVREPSRFSRSKGWSLRLRCAMFKDQDRNRGRGRLGIDRRRVDTPIRRDLLPRSGLKILA